MLEYMGLAHRILHALIEVQAGGESLGGLRIVAYRSSQLAQATLGDRSSLAILQILEYLETFLQRLPGGAHIALETPQFA